MQKPVVHIRVMAPLGQTRRIAEMVVQHLEAKNLEVIEVTAPQPSRSDESTERIYITVR